MIDFFSRLDKFMIYSDLNDNKITVKAGISNGLIGKGRKRGSISQENISKILYSFPELNADWLLTGRGEMLKSDKKSVTFYEPENAPTGRKLIPFYDIETTAGAMQVANMDVSEHADELIDAGDWFRDADSAMRVHGDSMFPVYKSGSIVVMKEVQDKSLIMYGQDYVLITSEYRVIKRIQKSVKAGFWLACSTNEETWEKGELAGRLIHEPFDVCIDSVHRIFRVLGSVSRTESSRVIYAKTDV